MIKDIIFVFKSNCMAKNIKTIDLRLTQAGVNRFKTVPTFKDLLHPSQISTLKEGTNVINVNHYIFSRLQQVKGYDLNNIEIIEQ